MSKIRGKAKRYDGAPIDYVSLFNWSDGKCIAQVVPDLAGNWVYDYFKDLNIGITYVSNGCEPITHGAYDFAYQFNPLDDALLHYDFNGDVLDKSASNLNGVKTGVAKFVSGRKSGTQALEFIAGCVRTPVALPINSEKLTISFWMKSTAASVGVIYEFSENFNTSNLIPALFINNIGQGFIDSNLQVTDPRATETAKYNSVKSPVNITGVWQHIVIEIDTSKIGTQEQSIYVDNTLTSTYIEAADADSDGNIRNNVLYIGQRAASSIPFIGSMQDMRVFDRILTSTERLTLFNE